METCFEMLTLSTAPLGFFEAIGTDECLNEERRLWIYLASIDDCRGREEGTAEGGKHCRAQTSDLE